MFFPGRVRQEFWPLPASASARHGRSQLYLLDTLRQSIRMDSRERSLRVVALSAILIVSLAVGWKLLLRNASVEEWKASTPIRSYDLSTQ